MKKQAPKKKPHPRGPAPQREGCAVRKAAIEVLVEAAEGDRFVDEVLPARLLQLGERDRHLLQEVVYGTARHMGTLDAIIDHCLKLPVARQRPAVAWALRVGAYQLVYLSRVPAHAAVNQTVEGLKAIAELSPRDAGFVNAVLHKVAAQVHRKSVEPPLERDDPTVLPIREGWAHINRPVLPLVRLDLAGHLALKHSHPRWIVERWLKRFGEEETRRLLEAQNRSPRVTVRVTRLAPSREDVVSALAAEGVGARPGRLPESIVLERAGGLERSEVLKKGWIQVQDETAMQIGAVLAPPEGARVLDLCAAPGGKALQLLERVGASGRLVAADRSEERLALVRANLSRFGAGFETALLPEDPAAIDLKETFTHVLVDAPCSNTGVFARRPEARWRLRRKDLESLPELQSGLLEAAFRHLAPGGRVVYATCSIEPEENENVVARAYGRHAGLVELETLLYLPHRTEADGGFFTLLKST